MGYLGDIPVGLRAWLDKEHNTDGTHADVTAESLTLQGALVGAREILPFDTARFSSGAGTWTITAAQTIVFEVSRVGRLACVSFVCDGSTLTVATTTQFNIALPELHALPRIGPTSIAGVFIPSGSVYWSDRQHATTGQGIAGVLATTYTGTVPSTRMVLMASFPLSNDLLVSASCWFVTETNNQAAPFYGL